MRFAILGISHETNTFSIVPATYEEFEKRVMARGEEIIDIYQESEYTISGYLQAAEELGFDAVPLMYANAGPIGTITKDAYDRITTEMFTMLRDQGPWDGILIANHGAAVELLQYAPFKDGRWLGVLHPWRSVRIGSIYDGQAEVEPVPQDGISS